MTRLCGFHIAVLTFCVSSSLSAATLTVDLNGGADFTTIQPAIDAAYTGDTVLVKPGEYVIIDPIDFKGKAITVKSSEGFDSTTIRITPYREKTTIMFWNGEGRDSVLEGFAVTGGTASGISCQETSPTLRKCRIAGNRASLYGGGLNVEGGSPRVESCLIERNWAIFFDRSRDSEGGGIHLFGGSPEFESCTIRLNWGDHGGALSCRDSSARFTGCVVMDNGSVDYAGAIVCYQGTLDLDHCTLVGNASYYGGAFAFEENPQITLKSCIVWDNAGGTFWLDEPATIHAEFSCLQGEAVKFGPGNIGVDPLFCGWEGRRDVFVRSGNGPRGSGTADDPFPMLADAFKGYSLALSRSSPCLGTGAEGTNMGAPAAIGDCEPTPTRAIHVGEGTYEIDGWNLSKGILLEGASADKTVVHGAILGLRTGARLSGITVRGDGWGGLAIANEESPEVSDCLVTETPIFPAVNCGISSRPIFSRCRIEKNLDSGIDFERSSSPSLFSCRITDNVCTEQFHIFTDLISCRQAQARHAVEIRVFHDEFLQFMLPVHSGEKTREA